MKTHTEAGVHTHLVEVGVSGNIVAPLLGVDEGFSLVVGLVHLRVHRLPPDQPVCHAVVSLNSDGERSTSGRAGRSARL